MSEATFNTEKIIAIGPELLDTLKKHALKAPRGRYRMCLHHSENDSVHEMLNVFCCNTYIRPHRHPVGKTESYHLIEGEMDVFIFNDNGEVIRRIELSEYDNGSAFLIRLEPGVWHMPVPKSEYVIFHETFAGPFRKELDVEYSSWSPEDTDTAGIAAFLKELQTKNVIVHHPCTCLC